MRIGVDDGKVDEFKVGSVYAYYGCDIYIKRKIIITSEYKATVKSRIITHYDKIWSD